MQRLYCLTVVVVKWRLRCGEERERRRERKTRKLGKGKDYEKVCEDAMDEE